MTFPEKVITARYQLGLSQEKLAAKLGVSFSTVNRWEKGHAIAGDWTGDKDAIDTLYKWKNSGYLNFDFVDAHSLTQARDTSLNCSIKRSLKERLDASKTFVLVVGANTKD